MTLPVKTVLRAMLTEPSKEWYGLELCDRAGLHTGTTYPILARLEGTGWLESRWEDASEQAVEGRPLRRYYRFSRDGAENARLALAQSRRPKARPARGPALQPPRAQGASS
jgi:PadR family transcriptional regulator, regulatory protein PadR